METTVLEIPFPSDILMDAGYSIQWTGRRMLELFVLELYKQHHISSGKGAEILGIGKYDFIRLLAEAEIDYFNYSLGELQEEFNVITQWKRDREHHNSERWENAHE